MLAEENRSSKELDIEKIEIEALREFKEKIEKEEKRGVIGDYELKRESEEYQLRLYYEEEERKRATEVIKDIVGGRVSNIEPGVIEYSGGYDGIRRILHRLEEKREIEDYVLGMIYRDLAAESERIVYVRDTEEGVEIYSEYSLDKYLGLYKVMGSVNSLIETGAVIKIDLGRSLKYVILIEAIFRKSFIRDLSSRFYLQEII